MLPEARAGKDHVLYVMRTTFRARSNPSLEVGMHMAASLNVPLICLAVIEDAFPSSSRATHRPTDRAQAFRLEALRELQPAFAARGTRLDVHVERDGCRPAVAMSLAFKAALVVSDEHFGVEPHASAAARIAQTGAPLWLCDCACTLPARLLGAAALVGGNAGFLRATSKGVSGGSPIPNGRHPAPPPLCGPPPGPPPSWSVDLSTDGAIDAILAAPSRRDTSQTRVRHTRGGPAATARWAAYVKGGGLKSYAAHRQPLAPDGKGASRMSAYINAGMIDPIIVARDALAARSDKFLSEFLGFRESAHLWCLLNPRGYAIASIAVPAWARGMLRHTVSGAHDAATPDLASLEAGRTGDEYWDDCQRCLNLSGELHNNVRMAWGKAIPEWHAALLSPAAPPASAEARLQAALDLLIYLNDKFALDGGAPPSYGGLLWCLGWRDRPGEGGRPTARPTSVMASKMRPGDLEKKARLEAPPGSADPVDIRLAAGAAIEAAKGARQDGGGVLRR